MIEGQTVVEKKGIATHNTGYYPIREQYRQLVVMISNLKRKFYEITDISIKVQSYQISILDSTYALYLSINATGQILKKNQSGLIIVIGFYNEKDTCSR